MTRFANVSNYINAGQLASAGVLSALAAAQQTSPNFAQTAQIAVAEQAKNEIQRYQLEGAANVAAYNNKAAAARDAYQASKIARDTEYIRQRQKKEKMAGRLAAAAQLQKIRRPDPVIPQLSAAPVDNSAMYDEVLKKYNIALDEILAPTASENAAAARAASPVNQSANTKGLAGGELPNVAKGIHEMILSDPENVSKLVSSEALRNTDDEFGVLANVYGRYRSSEFPNTVSGLAYQPNQYAGMKTENAIYDKKLIDRLLQPDSLSKAADFYNKLDGRLFFKSSQDEDTGPNYRPNEDMLFAPGGNYYHF